MTNTKCLPDLWLELILEAHDLIQSTITVDDFHKRMEQYQYLKTWGCISDGAWCWLFYSYQLQRRFKLWRQLLRLLEFYGFDVASTLKAIQRPTSCLMATCTRDENPPYCNAIWHYFSAILQILNTNRRVTDNAIRGHSGSDVALLALFWCKVALW